MPNPVPQSLTKQANKAASVIESFTQQSATKGPDKFLIPRNVIDKCCGLAVISVVRAGVFCAVRGGSGVVFAKKSSGEWSAPAALSMVGISGGFAFGVELTNFVLVLNTEDAVRAFARGNVTLGANVSVAAGPVGRSAEADVAIKNVAAVYTYSKSSGLFAGVSLEGAGIIINDSTNKKFFGRDVKAVEILTHDGVAEMRHYGEFSRLYSALCSRSETGNSSISPVTYSQHKPMKPMKSPTRSTSSMSTRKAPSPPTRQTSPPAPTRARAAPPPPSRSTATTPTSSSYGSAPKSYGATTTSSSSWASRSVAPNPSRSSYGGGHSSAGSTYTPSAPPAYENEYREEGTYGHGGNNYGNYDANPYDKNPYTAPSPYSSTYADTNAAPDVPVRPSWNEVALVEGRALFDFQCSAPGDLDLRKGDEVCVVVKDDNGWWHGRNMATGCYGVFPAAYVHVGG